jgi:hypothetical protein
VARREGYHGVRDRHPPIRSAPGTGPQETDRVQQDERAADGRFLRFAPLLACPISLPYESGKTNNNEHVDA